MRSFFYYGAIKKSIIKFLSIFDDMQIAKYNGDGEILKYVNVPIKFMPKQKFYSWLNLRSHEKRYPMIGVELTSIDFDASRKTGEYENIKVSIGEESTVYTTNLVPYNLGFTMSIVTEYISEQDQINEQLLPFFSPYVFTKINIPEVDIDWDMQVIFEGASIDTETTIDDDAIRNILWTHTYVVKTWLLKPTTTIDIIKKINYKFYLSDTSWDQRTTTETISGGGFEQEELLIIGSKDDDEILAKYLVFNDE